jgi:hypothetical protein
MNWSNYSSLKSGSKVSLGKEKETTEEAVAAVEEVVDDDGNITTHAKAARAKVEREFVALVSKSYDSNTGVANADSKSEYSLQDLEREKARYDNDMAKAKAQSDGLALAIEDFKKL